MRVARGMFRLWLVLTCLWIATVAAIGYSRWPSSTVQQVATSKDPKANDSKTYVPEFMKEKDPKADDSKTYVPEYLKDQNDPYAKYVNPDIVAPKADRFAEALKDFDAVNAQQLAVATAKLALIPPALIFVVGIGLTWAFRGFR